MKPHISVGSKTSASLKNLLLANNYTVNKTSNELREHGEHVTLKLSGYKELNNTSIRMIKTE